ncbi:MAG TPA: 3-oxoacyl-ACP reductase family protein [Thermoleophilaceae bacterium]|jgi:2-hydroxycyclohexanecarboxyl-CoA dehydrogenase|nr:3-oxoacyl-ACP reductase family protein [Thermoleophilaceae bacterium]
MSERVALVTGAAGGIGRAICLDLAADGRAVVASDVRLDGAEETASAVSQAAGRSAAVELDVTSTESVAAGVAAASDALGAIDIVVNNAGWDELRPFLETDEQFWDRVIELNFTGCLRVTRQVLPGMVERGFGRVVNVASDAGRVGSSLESVYSGAKGGVISFTKTIAREVARSGVTANAVCPGPTRTPLLEGMTETGGEKLIDSLTRAVPMRRLGEPEDVAAAVAFLASDRAGFITGQTLSVSGGLTMA